jgi:hypothetical protein
LWSGDGENSARVGLSVGCASAGDAENAANVNAKNVTNRTAARRRTIAAPPDRWVPSRSARFALSSILETEAANYL